MLAPGVPLALAGCADDAIHRSIGQYIDDQTSSARVNTALLSNNHVKSTSLGATTCDCAVQLGGFIESPEQTQRSSAPPAMITNAIGLPLTLALPRA